MIIRAHRPGEWRDDASGRIFVRVRTRDGLSVVPKDELALKGDAKPPEHEAPTIEEATALRRARHELDDDFDDGEDEKDADGSDGQSAPGGPPAPDPVELVECALHALKNNPDGPFSAQLLAQFERLKREQPLLFARLCTRYPALVAAVKLDAATVRAALENASAEEVVEIFLDLVLAADLNAVEIDTLRRLAAEQSGVGLRPLTDLLRKAQAKQAAQRAEEGRARRLAARTDPRPMLREPADTDPWRPVMAQVNAVMGASGAPEPPARDIDGVGTRLRKLAVPKMHAFDQVQSNPGDEHDQTAGTRTVGPPSHERNGNGGDDRGAHRLRQQEW